MNLLLLDDSMKTPNGLLVTGERALHIFSVLKAKTGDTVKAGFPGGNIGKLTVLEADKDHTLLQFPEESFTTPPPEKLPVLLAVALPRPQSFKKTLHFAVSSGIGKIIFFHSARVEKSFWNSSVLKPDSLKELIREGLEQGVDTVEPELVFMKSFREFAESSGELLKDGSIAGVIAHPCMGGEGFRRNGRKIFLALGPEGGFLSSEVRVLTEKGFLPMAFGKHILRVEFAASAITGNLLARP